MGFAARVLGSWEVLVGHLHHGVEIHTLTGTERELEPTKVQLYQHGSLPSLIRPAKKG